MNTTPLRILQSIDLHMCVRKLAKNGKNHERDAREPCPLMAEGPVHTDAHRDRQSLVKEQERLVSPSGFVTPWGQGKKQAPWLQFPQGRNVDFDWKPSRGASHAL